MTFDAKVVSLTGRHLVEASAGTGKTYSIANLFLRLLLEPHPANSGKPLNLQQILVVTFTNAATDELRGRIRRKVEEALCVFRGSQKKTDDEFIQNYKDTLGDDDLKKACNKLYQALLFIDEAAIFTIHSFAVKTIQAFLFETGVLADIDVIIGDNQALDTIKADLKRHSILSGDDFWRLISNDKEPSSFLELLKITECDVSPNTRVIANNLLKISDICSDKKITNFIQKRHKLKSAWEALLANYTDEKLATSDLKSVTNNNRSTHHLFKAIKKYFAHSDYIVELSESNINIINDLINTHVQWHHFLSDFKEYFEECLTITGYVKSLIFNFFVLKALQEELAGLTLDDVIRLLNNTLNSDNKATKKALQDVVTTTYPVCMVDEFQDTDPEQFRLFNKLYENTSDYGLFAIGDPKQSIYGFRGADIFAYLDVKKNIDPSQLHTLGTNFRSKQALVEAVNALFKEKDDSEPTFYYKGIEYAEIQSCETLTKTQTKGELLIDGKPNKKSLVFIGHERDSDDVLSFNKLKSKFANDTAERIVMLLKNASIKKNNDSEPKPVEAKDIAILVRDFGEANAIKKALAKRNLQAVYYSQKDSVFDKCIFSQDIALILRAIDEPNNKRSLKAAFSTPLLRHFNSDCDVLKKLEDDDNTVDNMMAKFNEYQQTWETKGVLAMLNQLLSDERMGEQSLADTFASSPERDRLMTDFRHIGELLQEQFLQTGSRERLIDWYQQQLSDDSELDEDAKSMRLESDANLIKIITLHGCKGLEYPIVFMPFFFNFKPADLNKSLPLYHQASNNQAIIDFESSDEEVKEKMNKEAKAENMRLFYVGVTRAIYQCYLGVSAAKVGNTKTSTFANTVWKHLLSITDENPTWECIKTALQNRMMKCSCEFSTINETEHVETHYKSDNNNNPVLIDQITQPQLPTSSWLVTSYTALAHYKTVTSSIKEDESFMSSDDELSAATQLMTDDEKWKNDIRFTLKGSANTGQCLHEVYEELAVNNTVEKLDKILERKLQTFGLRKSKDNIDDIKAWIQKTLETPLNSDVPSLKDLFAVGNALPELDFNFSIGNNEHEIDLTTINAQLKNSGVEPISRKDDKDTLQGIMTGSIDLLFVHDKKVYVLDYKSNTLGKSPRFYHKNAMDEAMKSNRYDLQYHIYSVAAHRYMKQRLGSKYDFDSGDYSFGGVFYLFVRGMGIEGDENRGIWFDRPTKESIEALDNAFLHQESKTVEVCS